MALEMTYKNDFGEVAMRGCGKGELRICKAEGFGPIVMDYATAKHTGQNGQRTISKSAQPRCITLSLELVGEDASKTIGGILRVLNRDGMLYIRNAVIHRRIFCNQVQIPDVESVLKGKILTFAIQFVCDNPYFEDAQDISMPLYGREKRLSTPFTLPCEFGAITLGTELKNSGDIAAEPQISIYCPNVLEGTEMVVVTNITTQKTICLRYAPQPDETVTIDVKNRRITGSKSGNMLNCLSGETFLGDFVLDRGINRIEVDLGDTAAGFTIECRYNNNYQEAVIV